MLLASFHILAVHAHYSLLILSGCKVTTFFAYCQIFSQVFADKPKLCLASIVNQVQSLVLVVPKLSVTRNERDVICYGMRDNQVVAGVFVPFDFIEL